MKLTSARVTEFRSVWDSGEFSIGDITCLVGKNEAGKTALLKAMYRINPIVASDANFDVTDDYPRAYVSDYEEEVKESEREAAQVVEVTFSLEEKDTIAARKVFGSDLFTKNELKLSVYYPNPDDEDTSTKKFTLGVSNEKGISFLINQSELPKVLQAELLKQVSSPKNIVDALKEAEATEETKRLLVIFNKIVARGLNGYIYDAYIRLRVPKFLYFDEYYQMKGHENLEGLKKRQDSETLEPSDYPMLGLIGLAGIDLEALTEVKRTQELKNKLEGAGNRLSRKVLQYWSQNKHVQMRFDVRPAREEDPEGMRTGSNIWAEIHDSRHMVSTNLGTRSKGFVWFFSFLAWYSRIQKDHKGENLILLLDEPGLFLHGRAQEDLLRYFEEELKSQHQVVYTTHSPFMVDSTKFERIRIVQDKGIDSDVDIAREEDGTKVIDEVLDASEDSLFPLQAALGYEIYQTLFIGPECLVVEGVSDLIYLQIMKGLLAAKGRVSLDPRWTITPVGGSSKVPTFVALLHGQKHIRIATLIDFQKKDAQTIEGLYKSRLLQKRDVLTFSDFTNTSEADIEDMFGSKFFLRLFNETFKGEIEKAITETNLKVKHPRILKRIEAHLGKSSNHFRPARHLAENLAKLEKLIPDDAFDRFEAAFKKLNSLL